MEINPAPLIIENRVFAGVRVLVEALGADIAWDADNQTYSRCSLGCRSFRHG
ncbi:MAG: copper amine oxidase N-terminal domain-containing protein [Armatimonadetes bacterium]|nr:copper amine oxidase N-terminal domain-containing protein [Armatimonadota bacterium]